MTQMNRKDAITSPKKACTFKLAVKLQYRTTEKQCEALGSVAGNSRAGVDTLLLVYQPVSQCGCQALCVVQPAPLPSYQLQDNTACVIECVQNMAYNAEQAITGSWRASRVMNFIKPTLTALFLGVYLKF